MLSTVAIGRNYERIVLTRLSLLGLRLANTGGAFDQGVDLVGEWALPSPPPPPLVTPSHPDDCVTLRALLLPSQKSLAVRSAPVVVQCKDTQTPVGVRMMREFQHAVAERFPMGTIAIVACSSGFALSALKKEKEWTLRTTLLLHLSNSGALISCASLGGGKGDGDNDDVAFLVTPLVKNKATAPVVPMK